MPEAAILDRMRKRLLALLAVFFPVAATACPEASNTVMFHSCWGDAEAESLLLPEESPVPPTALDRLVVTGGYTGKDVRPERRPNPVGMFIHRGQIINPTLARMDGVVILSPDGRLDIQHRASVRFGALEFDLRELAERRAFQSDAAAAGQTVFQSHLLISNTALDVRDVEDAPKAVRRLLILDDSGFGVYQTEDAVTLYQAAREVGDALAPRMAVNLDMGSYDYCLETREGIETNCGVLARGNTEKLSNLLVFSLKPRG
ncbi:MAG: hypothetical protein AAGH74_08055 [Pseudomonadota bacterium]